MIDIAQRQMLWNAAEVAAATGGTLHGNADWQAGGVSIDTRTLQRGDLFVALHATNDGHDFVAAALQKGAAAALVDRRPADVAADAKLLQVKDKVKPTADAAKDAIDNAADNAKDAVDAAADSASDGTAGGPDHKLVYLRTGVGVVAVVLVSLGTLQIARIGHSGAKATWGEVGGTGVDNDD